MVVVRRRVFFTLALLSSLLRPGSPMAAAEGVNATIRVLGGHPVKEAPDSILFRGRLDPGPSPVEGLPLAASAGSSIELVIETGRPAGSSVHCSWSTGSGEISGAAGFRGAAGSLEVEVPSRIGVYEFTLTCETDGGPLPSIESTLFVTFAAPLLTYSPPEMLWYERACSMAQGLASGAAERTVLEALLRGIRAYGSENWRYGYCVQDGSECFFGDERVVHPPPSSCFDDGSCICPWQDLLRGSECNFSDCFVLSEVLDVLAGVLGIRNLVPIRVEGSEESGFATRFGLQSLDPLFAGNLLCASASDPCSYLFGVHSLRKKGLFFYDATFTETYLHRDGPVGLNVDESSLGRGFVGFVDSPFVACRESCEDDPLCYDDWGLSSLELLPFPELCSEAAESQAVFTGTVSFLPAEDGASLGAVMGVEVRRAGTYTIRAVLVKDGRIVANLPFWTDQRFPQVEISGGPGTYAVETFFSGEQIYRSGDDFPFELRAVVFGESSAADRLVTLTPRYRAQDFGELACEILTVAYYLNEESNTSTLEVMVVLKVRNAEPFVLVAGLEKHGEAVAHAEEKTDLAIGLQSVNLEIPVGAIMNSGPRGPYQLTVVVYGNLLTAVDGKSVRVRDLGDSSVE